MANNPIQFFPRLGQDIGERAAGKNKSDQRRAGGVTACTKEISRQRSNFLLTELIFGCFVEYFSRVALLLVRVFGGFFGQRVEELVSAASSAQTVFPRGNLGGEFGQD